MSGGGGGRKGKLFLEQKSKWLQTSQNPQTGMWRGAASLLLEKGLALLATLHGPMEHATEWSTQLRSRNKTAFIRGRGRGDRGLTSGRLDVQTVPRPTHQLDPASATELTDFLQHFHSKRCWSWEGSSEVECWPSTREAPVPVCTLTLSGENTWTYRGVSFLVFSLRKHHTGVHAGLELRSSCLTALIAGITGMHHHAWLLYESPM